MTLGSFKERRKFVANSDFSSRAYGQDPDPLAADALQYGSDPDGAIWLRFSGYDWQTGGGCEDNTVEDGKGELGEE